MRYTSRLQETAKDQCHPSTCAPSRKSHLSPASTFYSGHAGLSSFAIINTVRGTWQCQTDPDLFYPASFIRGFGIWVYLKHYDSDNSKNVLLHHFDNCTPVSPLKLSGKYSCSGVSKLVFYAQSTGTVISGRSCSEDPDQNIIIQERPTYLEDNSPPNKGAN